MNERRILNTWKEIAVHLSRGVRTVQRWEINYRLPVHRPNEDAGTVYAFADEIDAWLTRTKPRGRPYVRPSVIVLDAMTPMALSDLKLAIEAAKFNVLTAYSAAEMLATAERYDVDGFVIDAVVLEMSLSELGKRLRERYPDKLLVLIGDDAVEGFETTLPAGNPAGVVEHLLNKLGTPRLE